MSANLTLVVSGLLLIALAGWRHTHSEAPTFHDRFESHQRAGEFGHDEHGYRKGGWRAEGGWGAVGKIEHIGSTLGNPSEEDHGEHNWSGGDIKIRVSRYYAKQIWPRRWYAVDFDFITPDKLALYYKDENGSERYWQSKDNLSAKVVLSVQGQEDKQVSFEVSLKRRRETDLYFAHMLARRTNDTRKWTMWDRFLSRRHHYRVRRLNKVGGNYLGLRGRDARRATDWILSLQPDAVVEVDIDIFWNSNRLPHAEVDYSFPAPPQEIKNAFPEAT